MSEKGAGYKYTYETTDDSKKFKENFKGVLVDTPEKFEEFLIEVEDSKTMAVDTETNGLDFYKHHICGISVSTSSYNGYYFPFRHLVGVNLPIEYFGRLWELFSNKNILFYNMGFDILMFKNDEEVMKSWIDISEWKVFEVMSLVFNADTNIKKNGLKDMSKTILNREVPTFTDVVGKKKTFDMILPEDGVYYACCDSANTFALYNFLFKLLGKECPFTLKLDNQLSKVMANYYLEQEITLNSGVMVQEGKRLEQEIKDTENEIYKFVGYHFNIGSNKQLSNALLQLGVDTGKRTKMGDMVLDKKVLGKLDHPLVEKIISRNSLMTEKNTYVVKMQEDKGRISYKFFSVPTGRLSSGNKKHPCYMKMNFMNLKKPKPAFYEAVPEESTESILGYGFKRVSREETKRSKSNIILDRGFVEGYAPEGNVRRGVTVPDKNEWYFVSCDYSQQELRIAGYLSGDKVLVKAYDHNEDVHKTTAISMFGEDSYDSGRRKDAKTCNFALLYDGTAETIHQNSNIPLTECKILYNSYWKALWQLKQWKRQQVSECYSKGGICYTAFGRPRRLKHYLTNPSSYIKGFGERSVVSDIVQGTGGDVLRIVLVRLNNRLFSHKDYKDVTQFVGCVHDEVNFAVRKEAFQEVIKIIKEAMEINVPKSHGSFMLPIDVEVGYDFGTTFGFHVVGGTWTPKYLD